MAFSNLSSMSSNGKIWLMSKILILFSLGSDKSSFERLENSLLIEVRDLRRESLEESTKPRSDCDRCRLVVRRGSAEVSGLTPVVVGTITSGTLEVDEGRPPPEELETTSIELVLSVLLLSDLSKVTFLDFEFWS